MAFFPFSSSAAYLILLLSLLLTSCGNDASDNGTGCDGISCNGVGSCVVVSDAPQCTCEAGYEPSGINR